MRTDNTPKSVPYFPPPYLGRCVVAKQIVNLDPPIALKLGQFVPPISKAREEAVLELLAAEAARLETMKTHARAAFKADGISDAEIDELIPLHPAGSVGI